MSKHDYHTSTVSGARAWAERHAEPDYDDRPTDADCLAEDAQDRIDAEREEIVDAMTDLCSRLADINDVEESWEIQAVIDKLYPV